MSKSSNHIDDPKPSEYSISFSEAGLATVRGAGVVRQTDVSMSVEDQGIALAFGTTLPPHLADLLDIAVAAYVADRLCVRRPRSAARGAADELWQRRMTIRLPLRDPAVWSAGRRQRVESLLGFLTDDAWSLQFTPERPKLRLSEMQGSLFQDLPSGDASAGLLSGGLDSLAGLTSELATFPDRTVVAFSAQTNRRIGTYQRDQIQALVARFGPRVRHIQVMIRLKDRKRGEYDREEPSQRTRGFVFQLFGAVTAAIAGIDSLHVYENGVGALNLPYSASQLGAQATRATNPITVSMASDLVSDVVGVPFHVHLPHQFATKAEMCQIFTDPCLTGLIPLTISCDSFPQRFRGKPQCGVCPSCLFSRQSLFSAGLRPADPSNRFRHDVYRMSAKMWTERSYHLRVMTMQAAAIAAATNRRDAWPALVYRYPMLLEIARQIERTGVANPAEPMLSLLSRYAAEWLSFWSTINDQSMGSA